MLIKIVTYGEMMLMLYILSTFSLLYFRNTVLCRLKLRFQPEIGGNGEIKIFLLAERVFKMLRIVTYQDRKSKLYILSTFFYLN